MGPHDSDGIERSMKDHWSRSAIDGRRNLVNTSALEPRKEYEPKFTQILYYFPESASG